LDHAAMQEIQIRVERVEVEESHVVQCARPIVDGGVVTIVGRIGMGNSSGERFARAYRNDEIERNTKYSDGTKRFHLLSSPWTATRPIDRPPLTWQPTMLRGSGAYYFTV